MTIKERILTAMTWGQPDQVPLTVYHQMFPRGQTERALGDAGVGLIVKHPPHRVLHRQVEIVSREYQEGGRMLIRRTIRTPVGEAWQLLEPDPAYGTSNWIREHFIKGPDDYRVLEYHYQDLVFQDNFDTVREARQSWPHKALWLNFTSSMHIERPEVIAAHTRQLLAEAGTTRGFGISVTEDAPVEALERSLAVIAGVLREHGAGS